MERHIAKRLGVPCAVISAPVHVQDFPARYSPQMGFEGANVLFDTWVHPLMMGLEEHLIGMFRGDVEFHEDAAPSHLGGAWPCPAAPSSGRAPLLAAEPDAPAPCTPSRRRTDIDAGAPAGAGRPGPPRPKRSCARFRSSCAARPGATPNAIARDRGVPLITIETLYDAKAHFSR